MHFVLEIDRNSYPNFIAQLTSWSKKFEYVSILNSNNYKDKYGKYEVLAGLGGVEVYKGNSFDELSDFYNQRKCWLFGHLGYDLKNHLEKLESRNIRNSKFENICFFKPKFLIIQERNSNKIKFYSKNLNDAVDINCFIAELTSFNANSFCLPEFTPKMTKKDYLKAIKGLQQEIQLGNIYEVNYCQEYYAENTNVELDQVYVGLNSKSPMPFSCFYKNGDNYIAGASPERFIAKRGNKIYSQPIKGTSKRGLNQKEDSLLKVELQKDLKEQNENVMIVDLVRNDLSKTAAKGSVNVEELFGAYTFPQVHQLISTVSSTLSNKHNIFDVLKTCFPMGSMTGAPKISAMQLADKYEKSRRELYSGTVGYISPEGDFDFNVVIRSLIYSAENRYLSLMVGGAITIMADPEKEYEECLLKAKAIFDL